MDIESTVVPPSAPAGPPPFPPALLDLVAHVTTLTRAALTDILSDRTGKDINKECGYPDTLTIDHYKAMYNRLGLAARVVKLWPDECWQIPPDVYEKEDQDSVTEFETGVDELLERLPVWDILHRLDYLSGIGQYGCLLIGLDDGLRLEQPASGINPLTGEVQETAGPASRKVLFLRPFDASLLTIAAYEKDEQSPRFGQPTMYRVKFMAADNVSTMDERQVHWTRMIHVADNREASDILGVPRLQNVYDHCYDVKKVGGGSGEMFWKGGFPGLSFELNPDVANQVAAVNWESVRQQVESYQQGLQRWLGVTGLSVKNLAPQVADPAGHVKMYIQLIALAKGVPWRMLMGSEEARLASVEDKRTWNTRLAHRQNTYLTPCIVRPLFDRLIALRALARPAEPYTVEWPDLNMPTEDEQAKVALTRTEALAKYVAGNVDDIVPPREYLSLFQKLSDEEIDMISDATEDWVGLEEPAEPEPVPGEALPSPVSGPNVPDPGQE